MMRERLKPCFRVVRTTLALALLVAAASSSSTFAGPKSSQVTVPLKVSGGGTFSVPVEINGRMTLDFILDSGVSDVSLPSDVFTALKRTGTVKESDEQLTAWLMAPKRNQTHSQSGPLKLATSS
jgi:predicted aspartyl protease